MSLKLLFKIIRPRNILILQFILIVIFLGIIKLTPNLSLSSVAEKFSGVLVPWIYKEHFYKSVPFNENAVVGYVNHHSVLAGETFKLFLSVADDEKQINGDVEISRIGYYKDADRKIIYRFDNVSVFKQTVSIASFVTGAAWKPLDNIIDTEGWRSGYYAIDFIKNNGDRVKDIAFVVVINPQKKGDILIKLSTNTYQAYNQWGGGALYMPQMAKGVNQADVVSFDRPTDAQFYRWEYYYVIWAEKFAQEHDLTIDYATNYDFYRDENIANNYTLLMSLGHDEYWSQREFDAYYNRIFVQGKNTVFLSANTAYWRVRYGDLHHSGEGRQLICYKTELRFENKIGKANYDPITFTAGGESRMTGLFRGQVGYPETMLMGVGYTANFEGKDRRYSYKVKTVLPWLFDGTNLKQGDELADVIGYEWDNTSLYSKWGDDKTVSDKGIPVWTEEKSYIPFLDRGKIQVVFEGDAKGLSGKMSKAQSVYFESDAGAKVFSAGTIRWAWGVGKPGFTNKEFQKINKNLITNFLK